MVRKFSGLVSPPCGCTLNVDIKQCGFVGAFLTLRLWLLIGQILVQRVGAVLYYQARSLSGSTSLLCSPRARFHLFAIWATGSLFLERVVPEQGWCMLFRLSLG